MDNKTFKEILFECMDNRGISPEKLAQLTGIKVKIIADLLNENFATLPADPYIKGYLRQIARVLHADYEELQNSLARTSYEYARDGNQIKKSGRIDTLPEHRYKITKKGYAWPAWLAIALMLAAGAYGTYKVFNRGKLEIASPQEEKFISNTSPIIISGSTNPLDKVSINDLPVIVNASGEFTTSYQLEPGVNIINIQSKSLFGKSETVTKEVFYQQ